MSLRSLQDCLDFHCKKDPRGPTVRHVYGPCLGTSETARSDHHASSQQRLLCENAEVRCLLQRAARISSVFKQLFLADSLGDRILDLIKLSLRTLKVLLNCLSEFSRTGYVWCQSNFQLSFSQIYYFKERFKGFSLEHRLWILLHCGTFLIWTSGHLIVTFNQNIKSFKNF